MVSLDLLQYSVHDMLLTQFISQFCLYIEVPTILQNQLCKRSIVDSFKIPNSKTYHPKTDEFTDGFLVSLGKIFPWR